MLTDDGPLRVEIPRDRDGSFEPILIPKHKRRFTGFDDKIVSMYRSPARSARSGCWRRGSWSA